MIKPTIGRIVWYWDSLELRNKPESQARAGIVTHVWGDNCINIALFTANGDVHPLTSVHLYQGEGEPPNERFCEWMPYQKTQASKTDLPMDIFAKVETLLSEVAQLKLTVAGLRQVDLAAAEATAKVGAGDLIRPAKQEAGTGLIQPPGGLTNLPKS